MDLKQILDDQCDFKVCKSDSNQKILDFYQKEDMNTSDLKVNYDRMPDFFKLLNIRGKDNFVFARQNKVGDFDFIGVLSLNKSFKDQNNEHVGYLGDMRVGHQKEPLLRFQAFYRVILEDLEMLGISCNLFLTSIMDKNEGALRFLTKNKKTRSYIYKRLKGYSMVNIVAKKRLNPSYKLKSNSLNLGKASKDDLVNFITTCESKKIGGVSKSEIDRRFKEWPNCTAENFHVLKKENKIVACFCPVDVSSQKKMSVSNVSPWMKFLFFLVAHNPFFKSNLEIKEGEEIKTLYLSMFNSLNAIEYRQILLNLYLDKFYKENLNSKYHFVSYSEQVGYTISDKLSGYFIDKTKLSLFQVFSKNKKDAEIEVEDSQEISFEMCTV